MRRGYRLDQAFVHFPPLPPPGDATAGDGARSSGTPGTWPPGCATTRIRCCASWTTLGCLHEQRGGAVGEDVQALCLRRDLGALPQQRTCGRVPHRPQLPPDRGKTRPERPGAAHQAVELRGCMATERGGPQHKLSGYDGVRIRHVRRCGCVTTGVGVRIGQHLRTTLSPFCSRCWPPPRIPQGTGCGVKVMGSALSPRRKTLSDQSTGPGARSTPSSRRTSVERAISASSSASGAPRQ